MEPILAGATERQRNFILDLLATREYGEDVIVNSSSEASKLIDKLLRAPKKRGATPRDSELFTALSAVQKSRYAIPVSELFTDMMDEEIAGDLLFLQVSEYCGTLYLRRLHGSIGGFTRTKMSRNDSLTVLRIIATDTYKYARLFGEHYSCCGKCGAELTDERSRALLLGPDCRKEFGY